MQMCMYVSCELCSGIQKEAKEGEEEEILVVVDYLPLIWGWRGNK